MRIPKLKAVYLAMRPEQYQAFETQRWIHYQPQTIDVATGQLLGTGPLRLSGTGDLADQQERERDRYQGALYVLRIPSSAVDRQAFEPAGANQWLYRRSIHLPHCGVERWEPDPTQAHTLQREIGAVWQPPASAWSR